MKIVKKVITYKCDECGKRFTPKGEYSSSVYLNLGGDNNVSISALVTIEKQVDYGYPYDQSTLCDQCKIKFLEMAIEKLRAQTKGGDVY